MRVDIQLKRLEVAPDSLALSALEAIGWGRCSSGPAVSMSPRRVAHGPRQTFIAGEPLFAAAVGKQEAQTLLATPTPTGPIFRDGHPLLWVRMRAKLSRERDKRLPREVASTWGHRTAGRPSRATRPESSLAGPKSRSEFLRGEVSSQLTCSVQVAPTAN